MAVTCRPSLAILLRLLLPTSESPHCAAGGHSPYGRSLPADCNNNKPRHVQPSRTPDTLTLGDTHSVQHTQRRQGKAVQHLSLGQMVIIVLQLTGEPRAEWRQLRGTSDTARFSFTYQHHDMARASALLAAVPTTSIS